MKVNANSIKNSFKILGLFVVGLITALLIYPFLHEGGHALIAFLVGADVVGFYLFPLPYVLCNVAEVDSVGQVLIGFGGIIIPFVLSAVIKPKRFWLWYTVLIIKGISLFAVILSLIATILYLNGISWTNEDIVQILEIFPEGALLFILIFVLMIIYGVVGVTYPTAKAGGFLVQ